MQQYALHAGPEATAAAKERAVEAGLGWCGTVDASDDEQQRRPGLGGRRYVGGELIEGLLSETPNPAASPSRPLVSTRSRSHEEDDGGDGWDMSTRSSCVLAGCLAAIGLSAFPTTETLLLQTSLFVKCLDWPEFYGLGTVTLFLPGLGVQIIQSRYDQAFNMRFGMRNAALFRLLLGHGMQLLALFVFFYKLWDSDGDGDGRLDPSDMAGKHMLLTVSFVFIGTGCAFVYGTCTQIIALFPQRYHAFFFVGTYSVSVCLSPVNYAIGDLYSTDPTMMECDAIHWERLAMYYSVGACCNLIGLTAFLVLCFGTYAGQRAMRLSEQDTGRKLGAQALALADRGGGTPGSGHGESSQHTPLERQASAPMSEVWKKCIPIGSTMVLCMVENMVVCNEYSSLAVEGSIPSLPTVMMYSFYAAQCVGSATVMWKRISERLTTPVLFALALLRLPGIVMIVYYTSQSPIAVANGTAEFASDWGIFIFFSCYMWLGGVIFSQSFSVATALFDKPDDRASGASVMNVLYFGAVCGVSGFILLRTILKDDLGEDDGCVKGDFLNVDGCVKNGVTGVTGVTGMTGGALNQNETTEC